MSLGIIAIWRARPRPQRLGLLIPREPLFSRPTSQLLRPTLSLWIANSTHLNSSSAAEDVDCIDRARISDGNANGDCNGTKASEASYNQELQDNRLPNVEELQDLLRDQPSITRTGRDKVLKDDVKALEDTLERSHFVRSVLVEPVKTYPHKKEMRKQWRSHHKSVTAQVLHERNRKNVGAEPADWRHLLELMMAKTPEEPLGWIKDGIKIEVTEKILARTLDEGGDDKIGAIRRRTGVSVKVSRGEQPGDTSTLLLSGSQQAMNMAIEEFRRITGQMIITRLWPPLAPGEAETETFEGDGFFEPPLSREEGAFPRIVKIKHHLYRISSPTTWSFRSFESYVEKLLDSVMVPHMHSPLYRPAKRRFMVDHERAAVVNIMRAFQNPSSAMWASCSALKVAFSFMCDKGDKYLPEVRRLFVRMDHRGLSMDRDIFNILLRAPVKMRNLRKFKQTLWLMVNRGHAPNLDTWILFLRMFESIEVKFYILRAMNMRNLLETPEAIRRVAEEMAPFDAAHAIANNKDLPTFLAEQKERYGPDWLTRAAGNKVLGVLSKHGRHEESFLLLNRMWEHWRSIPRELPAERLLARPDIVSFNAVISSAMARGKIPVAVNAVRKMRTVSFSTQPDETTLHLLFEMAWKSRLRATISVLWRYAALARLTSYRMRQRVACLLSGETNTGHNNARAEGEDEDFKEAMTISASTYRELGGERLAADLVGGDTALQQVRALAEGHNRAELGVIAANIWPDTFDDHGPGVSLTALLQLAVLMDFRYIRARKKGAPAQVGMTGSSHLIERAQRLPLWVRRSNQDGWIDLAPLDKVDVAAIRAEDTWSEMNLTGLGGEAARLRPDFKGNGRDGETADESQWRKETSSSSDGKDKPEKSEAEDAARYHWIAVMDPEVWADNVEVKAVGCEVRPRLRTRPRGKTQEQNEKAICATLERLSWRYRTNLFRRVLFNHEEETPRAELDR